MLIQQTQQDVGSLGGKEGQLTTPSRMVPFDGHGRENSNKTPLGGPTLPIETSKRKGGKRKVAASEGQLPFSQSTCRGNKRHCHSVPRGTLWNQKKRSGETVLVGATDPVSKKAKIIEDDNLEETRDQLDDDGMVICRDDENLEPTRSHHDAAADVWNFIGIG